MRSGRLGASATHRGAGCTATPWAPVPRPIKTQTISPLQEHKTKPGEAGAAAVFTSAQSTSGPFSRHARRSRSGTPQWMGGPVACNEHGSLSLHSFKNTRLVRSNNTFCLHLPLNRERDDRDEPLDFGCIPFSVITQVHVNSVPHGWATIIT